MPKYVTYVIALPEDAEATSAIVNGLRDLVEGKGGEITGMSDEDEMTVLDFIEQHKDFKDYIAKDAREQAKDLAAAEG